MTLLHVIYKQIENDLAKPEIIVPHVVTKYFTISRNYIINGVTSNHRNRNLHRISDRWQFLQTCVYL